MHSVRSRSSFGSPFAVVRARTLGATGADTSWIAPAIQASAAVTTKAIDAYSVSKGAKKKKRKAPRSEAPMVVAPEPTVIPWTPIMLGAGALVALALLMRKPAPALYARPPRKVARHGA